MLLTLYIVYDIIRYFRVVPNVYIKSIFHFFLPSVRFARGRRRANTRWKICRKPGENIATRHWQNTRSTDRCIEGASGQVRIKYSPTRWLLNYFVVVVVGNYIFWLFPIQMEKLHYSWHFYFYNDIWLLLDYLWWTIGIDDYGTFKFEWFDSAFTVSGV